MTQTKSAVIDGESENTVCYPLPYSAVDGCLNADMAHKAVVQLCKDQGEFFALKKNRLIKALADEGLLDSDKDKNVKSVSVYGKKGSIKLLCIIKEKSDQIIALSE